jgi:hypothetical protein
MQGGEIPLRGRELGLTDLVARCGDGWIVGWSVAGERGQP